MSVSCEPFSSRVIAASCAWELASATAWEESVVACVVSRERSDAPSVVFVPRSFRSSSSDPVRPCSAAVSLSPVASSSVVSRSISRRSSLSFSAPSFPSRSMRSSNSRPIRSLASSNLNVPSFSSLALLSSSWNDNDVSP